MSMKDFKVSMLLGKGSYGSVYRCKRKADGETYAVKESSLKKLNTKEREDAVNEIRILASINHPNIVRYCDAFVERDNLYIVMEFAERGDIYRKVKKYAAANRAIREEVIWSYLIQMCEGLKELHSRRILHRDIKPKNIFLTAKDHVKIGDLGCSKLMKQGLARTQIGTPYYMSPEIWNKRGYDTQSDMWALGCVIFEMCALKPPFLAKDMTGLSQKVRSAPTPHIPRHYSSDLQRLVSSLLSKRPSERPSCQAILSMSCVLSRRDLVPRPDLTDRWAADSRPTNLLDTIKIPKDMGRRRRLTLDLPEPCYPEKETGSSSSSARARAGAGAGAAAGAGSGVGAGAGRLVLSPGGVPAPPPPSSRPRSSHGAHREVRRRRASSPRAPSSSHASGSSGAAHRRHSRGHAPVSVSSAAPSSSRAFGGKDRSSSRVAARRYQRGPSSGIPMSRRSSAVPLSAPSAARGKVALNAGIAAPYAAKPW